MNSHFRWSPRFQTWAKRVCSCIGWMEGMCGDAKDKNCAYHLDPANSRACEKVIRFESFVCDHRGQLGVFVGACMNVRTAQIIMGVVGSLATAAAATVGFLSLLAIILSTSPSSAISLAWWSFALSLFAMASAGFVMVLGARRKSTVASLGFCLPISIIALIISLVMTLRLAVYYLS